MNEVQNEGRLRAIQLSRAVLLCGTLFVTGILIDRASAQEYMFTTLAGSGGPGAVDGPGPHARFNFPQGVAVDTNGNVLVADSLNATIRRISTEGTVTTLAGLSESRGTAD